MSGDELAWARGILAAYRGVDGQPVDRCALVRFQDRDVFADLTEDEVDVVREDLAIICFASLANREFFVPWPYSNTACFSYYGQRFTPPPEFTAVTARRRDGRTLSAHNLADTSFSKPLQASVVQDVDVDETLLRALCTFREAGPSDEWPHWLDGIECFNRANTDDESVSHLEELGLMASAFERLLRASSSALDVARKFDLAFVPHGTKLASSSHRSSPRWLATSTTSVRFEWMREFYIVRGGLAHGRRRASVSAAWSVQEHLVAAAFSFPLLMKLLLKRGATYVLSRRDESKIEAFEAILDADFGRPPVDAMGSTDTVMARAICDASSAIGVRRAVARLRPFKGETPAG